MYVVVFVLMMGCWGLICLCFVGDLILLLPSIYLGQTKVLSAIILSKIWVIQVVLVGGCWVLCGC